MKIGMIGCGSMGRTHAFALENMKYFYSPLPFEATLDAVCAAHYESAVKAAEQFGASRAVFTEDELIGDPSIEVIDICTPNIYHYETIKKAIAAGKHIYCEKPLCVTEAQAKEVAALAKEKNVTAQIVFNNRFLAPVLRAKELIEEGRLGPIVTFRAAYLHSSATDTKKKAGWKQDRDICGGGVLFDLGSHVIDLVQYLCGPIGTVSGQSQIYYKERTGRTGESWQTNADEAFYLTCGMDSGAVGTITVSKLNIGANDDLTLEIYGEKGALKFDLMDLNWLWFYDGAKQDGAIGGERGFTRIECVSRYPAPGGVFPGIKAPSGWLRGHIGSLFSFLSSVEAHTPASPSFDDGARVQAVMERAYQSDKDGSARLRV